MSVKNSDGLDSSWQNAIDEKQMECFCAPMIFALFHNLCTDTVLINV